MSHFQRGTQAIKKYLVSRIEEPLLSADPAAPGVKSTQGQSGVVGGGDLGVDPHTVTQMKALNYRLVNAFMVLRHHYFYPILC